MTQNQIAGEVRVVDPLKYFADWAYTIRPELFIALGVHPRQVIDKEKTQLARSAAIARGLSSAEATKRVRVMRREIVINTPGAYCFEIGDIFYRGIFGGQDWLQVMAIDTRPNGDFFETHFPLRDGRIGYSIPAALIEHCLRTGQLPASQYRIGITQRSSLVLLSDVS